MEHTRTLEQHDMTKFTNYRQKWRNISFHSANNTFNKIMGENCSDVC